MGSPAKERNPLETVLYVVGGIGFAFFFWKGSIEGYYPWEAPMLFAAGGIGAVALLIASRMTKRRKSDEIAAHDRAKGVL